MKTGTLLDRTGPAAAGQALIDFLGLNAEGAIRLAYHLTRDREAALDISQEAFLKALGALGELQDAALAKVWFNRIVVNLCRDWIRRKSVERRGLDVRAQLPPRDSGDPARFAEEREELERMRALLMKLPGDLREAVVLVCVEGQSPRDAAEILGIKDGTLRWRLHEGRKQLMEAFES